MSSSISKNVLLAGNSEPATQGKTIIAVLYNLNQALWFADEIALLANGEVM